MFSRVERFQSKERLIQLEKEQRTQEVESKNSLIQTKTAKAIKIAAFNEK